MSFQPMNQKQTNKTDSNRLQEKMKGDRVTPPYGPYSLAPSPSAVDNTMLAT